MSRLSKEEAARQQGISWVFRQLDAGKTLDEVRQIAKDRGAIGIPVAMDQQQLNKFQTYCHEWENAKRQNILDTLSALSLFSLMDFTAKRGDKWGTKRLLAWRQEFNDKLELMNDQKMTWTDVLTVLREEAGLDMSIRWAGDDPTAGFDPLEH